MRYSTDRSAIIVSAPDAGSKRLAMPGIFLSDAVSICYPARKVRFSMLLRLGHSPDPDDAFMFYALAKDKMPTHGYQF
jgi:hypothetical protein